MNKKELQEILSDWNFWDKDLRTGVPRDLYLNLLTKRVKNEQIKIIIGARRTGKSYIMRQLAQTLIQKNDVPKKNILIVNFEDPRFTTLNTQLLDQIFTVYQEICQPQGEIYLFLDEIQEMPGWEKWVRTIHELNKANIIISGSNSKLLSGELATVLTGRHLDTTVMPLSFLEFLRFKGIIIKTAQDLNKHKLTIKVSFDEYCKFGAFPLVTTTEQIHDKENTLLTYYDDVIHKDLIKRYKVRKTAEIKSLVKFYLSNVANPITFNACGKFLNLSTLSVERFSSYLENSYLVFFLKRFSYKVKEQEKSARKVYAIDTGLANVVGFQFSNNSGKLTENLVFLELKRRMIINPFLETYYWKNSNQEEVDFVIKHDTKIKELIQVCFNPQDEMTKRRETKALLKAMNEFKLKTGLIITDDYDAEETYDNKKIIYISLWRWLLKN